MVRSSPTDEDNVENPETCGWTVGEFTPINGKGTSEIGEVPRTWLFKTDDDILCTYYPAKQNTWRKANANRWQPDPEKWLVYRFRILGDTKGI